MIGKIQRKYREDKIMEAYEIKHLAFELLDLLKDNKLVEITTVKFVKPSPDQEATGHETTKEYYIAAR